MKKILVGALAAIVALPCLAALDVYEPNNYVTLLAPRSVTDQVVTGSAVNVKSAKGIAAVVLVHGAGATNANHGSSLTLQQSANGSTGWTNVSGFAVSRTNDQAASISVVEYDTATTLGYLRVLAAATNGAAVSGALIVYPK